MSDNVTRLVPLHELPDESRLVVNCAANIKPAKIDWLWEQRLPLGKCVLVAGEGGLGKSMVLAWIASTVSRGKEWPCGEGQSRCGSTIILSAEDDAADTIVPRLLAADADCNKVHILESVRAEDDKGQRSFNLQLDLPELERKIADLEDVLLVIIDPITSYLGKVDSHKNAELRSVLEPLGKMAARRHVAVIANTHLSKASGGSANSRVIGSVAFINHARAAFIVTADPEDSERRLFIPSKTNLGKPRDGLAYRIADTVLPCPEGSVIWAPYVKWEDAPVTMSADEAMAANAGGVDGKSALEEAKQFLIDLLADGGMGPKEIRKAADDAGLTWATVRRAKGLLGIKSCKAGMDAGWVWALPKVLRCSEGAQASGMSTFGGDEHLRGPRTRGYAGGDDFEERAAILEYDAGLSRAEAEAQAAKEMPDLPAFLDRRVMQ
jgi:putative DNA primase/helicase